MQEWLYLVIGIAVVAVLAIVGFVGTRGRRAPRLRPCTAAPAPGPR